MWCLQALDSINQKAAQLARQKQPERLALSSVIGGTQVQDDYTIPLPSRQAAPTNGTLASEKSSAV